MKRAFCLLMFVAAASICLSQSRKPSAWPDLRGFSSDQLKSCYDYKSICGTDNIDAITDELERRLPTVSTEELVKCFADWKVCGVGNDLTTGWAVSDEVARRGNPHGLLVRYWTEPNPEIRDGIVHVAYHFKTPETSEFMRKVLIAGQGDDDALYWPADYLAQRCDSDALDWLSSRQGRPEGCLLWAPTVTLFGKCHYRPAIPYLIDNSLADACLNIVDAGEIDLRTMYPHSPKDFNSIPEMTKYYCSRALKEGFKVDCSQK